MFELHIANPNISTGNLAVSWCADKETLNFLAKKGINNPSVVLIVAPEFPEELKAAPKTPAPEIEGPPAPLTEEEQAALAKKQLREAQFENRRWDQINKTHQQEYRKVVPLKDLETYVELHTAGQCNIYGFISDFSRYSQAASYWMRRNGGEYYRGAIQFGVENSNIREEGETIDPSLIAAPLSIEVPVNCFAKKPSEWEQAWVNWLFNFKPENQCQFRKRRLWAYTLQPFLLFAILIPRIAMMAASFICGMRSFSFKYLLHPLTYSFDEMMGEDGIWSGGTVFVGRGGNETLNWLRLPFMPVISVPLFFFIRGLAQGNGKVITLGLIFLGVILVLTLGLFIGYLVVARTEVFDWIMDLFGMNDKPWYLEQGKQELVLCGGDPTKKPRSIKLYYLDLKAKICKPYSK